MNDDELKLLSAVRKAITSADEFGDPLKDFISASEIRAALRLLVVFGDRLYEASPVGAPGQQSASLNTGHGHVRKRPDGVRMRCGGPGVCAMCSAEAAQVAASNPADGSA